jgi:cell division transport system permease protein
MRRKAITFSRVVKAGMVNFFRNAWLGIAAIAVMVVTLTIVLFSILTNATFNNTIGQIREKIDVSVYLIDDIPEAQREKLLDDLRALPNAAEVDYLSKDEVLEQQKSDTPDLPNAVEQLGSNPLPATIHVKPKDLNKIQEIKDFLSKPEIAVLQSDEPSYSGDRKEAIDKITHATNTLQRAGVAGILIFAFISMLIIFNTIQMAIFNRRDELTIMRLLGASTWYIRGPFVVETIFYGVVSALLSTLFIHGMFVAASSALEASSLGLLDIKYSSEYFYDHFWAFLTMQLMVGILIGAVSSIVATQRYLKFKTTK